MAGGVTTVTTAVIYLRLSNDDGRQGESLGPT
jgi:hypothetical protein